MEPDVLASHLEAVKSHIIDDLEKSVVGELVRGVHAGLFGGKMLRSRLVFFAGTAAGLPVPRLVRCAAAVEMVHVASLLHDDVVDGGVMRRGQPAFWVEKGAQAAILMGDWLISRAAGHLQSVDPALLSHFFATLQEMCDAEIEQEMLSKSREHDWAFSESIALRKTGSLFGFAAYCAAAGTPGLREALRLAGRDVGTAYQLADDIQDRYPPEDSDKTLGLDQKDGKCTVADTWDKAGIDPVQRVRDLCVLSAERLLEWPEVHAAWNGFLSSEISPVMSHFMQQFAEEKVS